MGQKEKLIARLRSNPRVHIPHPGNQLKTYRVKALSSMLEESLI